MSTPAPATTAPEPPARHDRRVVLGLAALAAVVAAVAVVTALALGRDDAAPRGQALELTTQPSDVATSCIAFDEALLAEMSPAFAATATSVEDGAVLLDVDRWYRTGPEGEVDAVRLTRPDPQSSAALDGVPFETGARYLVTAADGVVNGCGFSGPATPELEAAFDRAFS